MDMAEKTRRMMINSEELAGILKGSWVVTGAIWPTIILIKKGEGDEILYVFGIKEEQGPCWYKREVTEKWVKASRWMTDVLKLCVNATCFLDSHREWMKKGKEHVLVLPARTRN